MFVLSEKDRDALREVVREVLGDTVNTRTRSGDQSVDHAETTAPEVYVARTPLGGIPALIDSVPESDDTGTGTGSVDHDRPGSAECEIYRALRYGGVFGLTPVPTFDRRVLNLSRGAINGDRWILIHRDKFGQWYTTEGVLFGFTCLEIVIPPITCIAGSLVYATRMIGILTESLDCVGTGTFSEGGVVDE